MFRVGVPDFSLQDMYKPTKERTLRNLSGIINFGKYREERLQSFQLLEEEAEKSLAERQRLVESRNQLAEELQSLKENRENEQPQIHTVRQDVEENILPRLESLFRAKDALAVELKTTREHGNSLAVGASQKKLELAEETRRRDRLQAARVQSPERMARARLDREEQLDRERAHLAQAEDEVRQAVDVHEHVVKLVADMQGVLTTMGEVQQTTDRKKEVSRRVKELRALVEVEESQLLQTQAHAAHVERMKSSAAEKVQRLQTQSKQKKDFAQLQLEQQAREKEAIEAVNNAKEAKRNENEEARRQLEDQKRQMEREHAMYQQLLVDKYRDLRAQLTRYIEGNRKAYQAVPILPPPLPQLTTTTTTTSSSSTTHV